MNKIYDFDLIDEIRSEQKKLIVHYAILLLFFVLAIVLLCIVVENNVLLTVIFAILLFFCILASMLFWKIKYGILNEYKKFLDNIETGKRDSYVGCFEKSIELPRDDLFDSYVFVSSNKRTSFLIHKYNSTRFDEGKKYHIEHIGVYVYQWEIIE